MAGKTDLDSRVASPRLLGSSRLSNVLMCLLASFITILTTINLGIAIVCMAPKASTSNVSIFNDSATFKPNNEEHNMSDFTVNITCDNQDELKMDKATQGMLLSAPYYGVVVTQLATGWLCDKFGRIKLLIMSGVTILGIASVTSPAVIQLGFSYFFALRIVKGVGMAMTLSSVLPLLSHWMTPNEQGLLMSLSFAGIGIGNAATYPISGYLCKYGGWKSIFYYPGGICFIWLLVAYFFLHDTPASHPRIGAEEKQFLSSYVPQNQTKGKKKIPWAKILTSIPVWSVILTNFVTFGAIKGISVNLPLFIKDVLDFSVTENGIFSALPAVCALVCRLATGPISDWARTKGCYSITSQRKIFHTIGTIVPAILLFVVSQLHPEQKYGIIGVITIGYSMTEVAIMGGYRYSLIDVAPRYIGVLQGLTNSIGLAPGFIMPVVIAKLTQNSSDKEWGHVFMMISGLMALACFIWVLTGSSERQKWAEPQINEDKPEADKQLL